TALAPDAHVKCGAARGVHRYVVGHGVAASTRVAGDLCKVQVVRSAGTGTHVHRHGGVRKATGRSAYHDRCLPRRHHHGEPDVVLWRATAGGVGCIDHTRRVRRCGGGRSIGEGGHQASVVHRQCDRATRIVVHRGLVEHRTDLIRADPRLFAPKPYVDRFTRDQQVRVDVRTVDAGTGLAGADRRKVTGCTAIRGTVPDHAQVEV